MLPGIIGDPVHRLFTKYYIRHPYKNNQNSASLNYFYLYFWKSLILSSCKMKKKFDGYQPSCPVSYMYGTDKAFQFHND